MKKLECVLFDADGTIFDTARAYYTTLINSYKKLGYNEDASFEFFKKKLVNKNYFELLSKKGLNLGNKKDIEEFQNYFEKSAVEETQPFKGIEELIKKLYNNVKLGIVSNADFEIMSKILSKTNLEKYFSTIIYESEKPGISGVNMSVDLLSVPKNGTVLIGDEKIDAICAANAGINFIGVSWGYSDIKEFERYKKIGIAKNVGELESMIFSLMH
ncbi:Phosphoglycolate phosphatase [Candidatus Tiddalikarchaeum anstoanum]|nr:Phosphoglycolate phosphatase [Candidatus Tiddalikarchaeum anstoanum]